MSMSSGKRPPTTRSEWVYQLLKEKILSGQYEPLQRVVADQIARELGTSVIPVREAIHRLETEGLMELEPYVGARVAAVSETMMEELFEMRKVLEPLLAQSAVAAVTPDALAELETFCDRMDDALAANDMLEYSRLNFQFHDTIYQLSPWKTMYQVVRSIWDKSARSRWVFSLAPNQAAESQGEHRTMLQALREKDEATLHEMTRTQKERAFQAYLHALRNHVRTWV
jgi:DNA-binding GntR family transcriptional regulator